MDQGFSRGINAIQQGKAFHPRHRLGEGLSSQLVFGFAGHTAKSRIDVAKYVIGSCECGHQQGRTLKEYELDVWHIELRIKARVGIDFGAVKCFIRLGS